MTRDVEAVADACQRLPQCIGTLSLGEKHARDQEDKGATGLGLPQSPSCETLPGAEGLAQSPDNISGGEMAAAEGSGLSPKRRRLSASPLAMVRLKPSDVTGRDTRYISSE